MSEPAKSVAPPRSCQRLFEFIEGPADERIALVFEDRTVSYGELRARVSAFAGGLGAAGFARGDRLALWLPNTLEWVALALACSRLGVGVVSLNVRWGAKEVGDMLARTSSRGIVLSSTFRKGACVAALREIQPLKRPGLACVMTLEAQTQPVLQDVRQIELDTLRSAPETDIAAASGPDDEALIIATSGTTSVPKLVVHTQGSVCRHAVDVAACVGIGGEGTSALLAVPMCGAYGYTILVSTLAAQRPLVVMAAFEPAAAAALIGRHSVTHMLGTNDMLDKMLDAVEAPQAFPSLRMFGHANFDPSLTQLPAKAQARGVLIRGFYGMSELLAGFAAQPADLPLARRAEAGGVPTCAEASFEIRDPDTGREAAVGEIGELVVQTPNRMREYLDNPEATAAAFSADGHFRTGDLAYRLADGAFHFVSRMNDVLRIGGYLVSPSEIEEVLMHDPTIAGAQVVAVATPNGVRPVAFAVARADHAFDEAQSLRRCRSDLAIYKVPIRIFAIAAVPMIDGPNGLKVNKVALRAMAASMLAMEGAT